MHLIPVELGLDEFAIRTLDLDEHREPSLSRAGREEVPSLPAAALS